eukprot:CAMPEP_0202823598 /NCGR_PEP_ID=MMETSP1389-20130828/11790_1 /ASSEMBLY_ACC=CAM_ASM_000865 /TAXON_ID=302021 /ORGANISM="Rhodomonas sp., Strain CCMP768" /LENGTH=69 /DNA_ID=CAMNT_0049496593 /DNA_START=57 /DNA_END=262 /DNA_ORIENTATION=+
MKRQLFFSISVVRFGFYLDLTFATGIVFQQEVHDKGDASKGNKKEEVRDLHANRPLLILRQASKKCSSS